jgi:predicted nucleotidyltransferase
MHKVCNINLEQRGQIAEQIERYCQDIVSKLNPHAIILFGSFATGDINEGSDIDILVVADFEVNFLDRIKLLINLNRSGLPIEPIGYTPEEFDRMKGAGNAFVARVLKTGRMLYRRPGRKPTVPPLKVREG